MTITLINETHSTTLDGLALELQVDAPFVWRTGWEYS
jgi:hypothetical protein